MGSKDLLHMSSSTKCRNGRAGCTCSSMKRNFSGTWLRSVKRKFDDLNDDSDDDNVEFCVPGFDVSVARVEITNECDALREMVTSQQQTLEAISIELDEERNASSSAANEAMSMILRLQREKAGIQMEARQFKRFAEEKMAHDQQELAAMEDLLYKREQTIESLYCEVQAYKHRMLSYGFTESEADGERGIIMSRPNSVIGDGDSVYAFPTYDYPRLKCNVNANHLEQDHDGFEGENYDAFTGTPPSRGHLKDIELMINQMEDSPRQVASEKDFSTPRTVFEKVIVGHSPIRPKHLRKSSADSGGSQFAPVKEMSLDFTRPRKVEEEYSNLRKVDNVSEVGDEMSDRVYTVDSIHHGMPYKSIDEKKPYIGECEDFMSTPKGTMQGFDDADPYVLKLYTRLQALEADKESMRQALISMRTDKAQLVLLKEIAQQLCKEMSPDASKPVKKLPVVGSIPFTSVFKWVSSVVFWRKKAQRSKYMFGKTGANPGLLGLLDKGPRVGQWRCLSSAQV